MHNECAHTHRCVCVCICMCVKIIYWFGTYVFISDIGNFLLPPHQKNIVFNFNVVVCKLNVLLIVLFIACVNANFNNRIHFIFMGVSLIRNSKWNAFSLLFLFPCCFYWMFLLTFRVYYFSSLSKMIQISKGY